MSRFCGRRAGGQGAIEYILLIGLLAIIGVSIWVLTGPGIGNVYRQIAPPTGEAPAGAEPGTAAETAVPAPVVQFLDAACGQFTVAGDARIAVDETSSPRLLLGGPSDCSLVIEFGAGPADPLVLDPTAKPARLHCVAIEDMSLVVELLGDVERTFFALDEERIAIRIGNSGEGPALFVADLLPHYVLVEKESLLIHGDVTEVGGDNRIDSPTLAALGEGGAATLILAVQPRQGADDAPALNLIEDRFPLRELRAGFRLEVLGAGCD